MTMGKSIVLLNLWVVDTWELGYIFWVKNATGIRDDIHSDSHVFALIQGPVLVTCSARVARLSHGESGYSTRD